MQEKIGQPMLSEYVTGPTIDRPRLHSRPNGFQGGGLRLEDRLEQTLPLRVGSAERQHARHVAGVTVKYTTMVNGYKRSQLQPAGSWPGVRQRAMGAGGDDGVKRKSIGAQAPELTLDLGRQPALGPRGPRPCKRRLEGLGVQISRAPQPLDLRLVLDDSKLLYKPCGRDQTPPGGGESAGGGVGKTLALEGETPHALPGQALDECGHRALAARRHRHLDASRLAFGLLGESSVGE